MAIMAGFALTERERQLLRLALCSSAQGGEITTSAEKLIQSLRRRNVESGAIETALEGIGADEPSTQISRPDYGLTTMPWGKHRGKMFMDIEPSYLRFIRRWIADAPDRAVKFKSLAEAIEQFLEQR